jgi:5-methylcytosine-specific restriction endonuclease McrA
MSYRLVSIKYMFDTRQSASAPDSTTPAAAADGTVPPGSAPVAPDPSAVPLERLEAQICELAGHLTAATCRFLVLLGDFDARRGWASWDLTSCAAWLSWKCQMSSGTAREHVRVARALRELPVIRSEFGAGRLSYTKVRALTRIATAENEAGLAEIAGPMTGNQLERFARAHRRCSDADDAAARVRRRLTWRFEDDGSLAGAFRLPPLAGAALLKALRAAAADLEHPPGADERAVATSSSLADALVTIAESFLAGQAAAGDPDVYQVLVHVGIDAIADGADPVASVADAAVGDGPVGVSAETPRAAPPVPGGPADPARCHVEDGSAISAGQARMLACTAAVSWMLHDRDGTVLDLGRRRRRPTAALRRAARERDNCRCRFPGCESRRVDLHHIQYWSRGGRTELTNLISLCKYHHTLIHDRGYLIAAGPGGAFAFYRPDGTAVPASPALPTADGTIDGCHEADVTANTIVPPWYGERLDLDHAIYVCLANARNQARQHDPRVWPDQPDREGEPAPFRPRVGEPVYPFDWLGRQSREPTAA